MPHTRVTQVLLKLVIEWDFNENRKFLKSIKELKRCIFQVLKPDYLNEVINYAYTITFSLGSFLYYFLRA